VNWRVALTVVLLLAALVSGWSAWRQRADDAPVAAQSQRPDYVLEDFELVSLDTQGKEAFTLRAPRLARDPSDGTMSLQTPLFLLPDTAEHYWRVTSDSGWVSAGNDELRLRGDVVAQTDPASGREMRMATDHLNVFPDTRVATSDAAVTITQPGTTMRGTGLHADLASKRIQLHSNVETRYVPTRR
jgi:lipopolysaccharide export system protein LptC